MMLGYNNYSSRTHHLHNHFSPTRNRQQLDDNNNNVTHDYSGGSSFYPTTPTSQQQNFDDSTLRAAAASAIGINSQSLNQVPDLMPSESWMVHSQHTPTAAQRFGHQRESSLSSLGSNGPASPYNHNLSNPQIAVTDSGSDGYHELNSGDSAYSYRPSKSVADNFYTSALANYNNRSHHRNSASNGHTAMSDMGFHDGLPNLSPSSPAQQKLRSDRGLAPAPDLSASGGSSTASHPVSVASSTADGDSPHTPSLQEPEDHARRRKNGLLNPPPKLDRTLTDIYTDELYNPNFTLTSASPPQTVVMSPTNDIFAQRLQAANSHHLSAAQSPESGFSRERSPFRQGSPYASTVNDFSQIGMNQVRLGSAQQMREKRKAEQDSREIQQQLARNAARQQGTPNTISPKDAVLDFNDTDDASNFPLFPPQEASAFNNLNSMNDNHNNGAAPQQSNQPFRSIGSATPVQSAFDFSMPANIQMPQQYPFIPRPQQEHHQQPATPSNSNFSRVGSAEASTPDYGDGSVQKPSGAKADGGTYTCTYHGCTLRFETPALLQKHKREGHRQANALNAVRDSPVGGMTSSLLNSQAGPHKCERINPSTGKPCNTIFSRPYDLTRHEDTIHNARKQKVRCDLCTEEKTFSRADALTRHYRVCHPDVEFPGKHRRRGGGIS